MPHELTARDLMTPYVVRVREDLTVQELAAQFIQDELTAAPVEDGEGNLVGFVSTTDIAHAAADGIAIGGEEGSPIQRLHGWEGKYSLDELRELHIEGQGPLVRDIMTPLVLAVDIDARVPEIARKMIHAHLHRLLVREGDEIVGIVSTTDLLGLLVEEEVS